MKDLRDVMNCKVNTKVCKAEISYIPDSQYVYQGKPVEWIEYNLVICITVNSRIHIVSRPRVP